MSELRQKMKNEMTLRGLSLGTQDNYLRSVIKVQDYFKRNPAKLSIDEIKSFLLNLANQPIAASTYYHFHLILTGLRLHFV